MPKMHKLWLITNEQGDVLLTYCQCPGGACRHVGAPLYAIEDMAGKSAMDGPPQWVQRSNACEEPMKLVHVPFIRARYGTHRAQKLPSADVVGFDPRDVGDRKPPEAREAEFAEMLQKEWGRQKEPRARSHYWHVERQKHKKLTVEKQGLRISRQKPFIGCSVDGLVSCECHVPEKRLVEIKCPFNLRFMTPKEAAKQRGCKQDPVNGAWSLKENSPFYYQIQAQLFGYGLSHCDLVIYTHQGILSMPVKYNNLFASEMVRKVEEFYKTHVAPTLLYDDVH